MKLLWMCVRVCVMSNACVTLNGCELAGLPTCIEALDKNAVKIQICVLVSTDACHNQDGHAR